MYKYSMDFKALRYGTPAADGDMSASLTPVGDLKENSLKISAVKPNVTNVTAAGKNYPAWSITKKAPREFSFDLLTMDPEVIMTFAGGSVTKGMWAEADAPAGIEMSLEIEDYQGNILRYPRCSIMADPDFTYSATEPNVLRVFVTVLQPQKAGTKALYFGKPTA